MENIMKKYDVVALGELLIDFTENGKSNQGNPLFEANPGGAPCNVLAMLTKLGHKTAFIGKVGEDFFGEQLRDAITEAGIDAGGLCTDKEIHTTLAMVHTYPDGDRDFSFYRNPGADMMLNKEEVEELYDISNPKEPAKVAEHKDINDDGQTVLITERIIKIHTTATDKNGKKEIEAGKDVTIVDKVTLDGLEVGTKYKLSGWQMLKEENAELLIDGKKVSNDYEFTADSEKMTVEIAFTFDGSSLGGKSLVTFEELYDMTNPDEPKKVTEHKDITDDGQTVTIKEVPEVPDTPKDTDTPDTPSTVTKTSDSPKTGDNTNIYAYLAMLGLSCVGLGGMLYFKRRRKKSYRY